MNRKQLVRAIIDGQLTEHQAAQIISGEHHGNPSNPDGRPLSGPNQLQHTTSPHTRRRSQGGYRDLLARLQPDQTIRPVHPCGELQMSMTRRRVSSFHTAPSAAIRGRYQSREGYSRTKTPPNPGVKPSDSFDWDHALYLNAQSMKELGYVLTPQQQQRLDDHEDH